MTITESKLKQLIKEAIQEVNEDLLKQYKTELISKINEATSVEVLLSSLQEFMNDRRIERIKERIGNVTPLKPRNNNGNGI